MAQLWDLIIHLDKHLASIIQAFGIWTYLILFLIVFAETGFVVTPFLPGDSLLFVAGTFAAAGSLNVFVLFAGLCVAAVIGDSVNYEIGKYMGPRVFTSTDSRLFNRKNLEKTQDFYERHGAKTIILARFVPIVRTFAPFVAGVGRMNYLRFLSYNIVGGIAWVAIFLFGGFFFGNIPIIKDNLTVVIMLVIVVSVLPGVAAFVKERTSEASR